MFASLARLILVTALAVSALAAPDAILPTRSTAVARSNPVDIVVRQLANNSPVHLTNAQRLARGLPPKRPRSFHEGRAIRPRQSSNCVPVTGIISVTSDVDNANGYISRINNGFGEYTLTTDPSQALSVSFCQTESSSGFFNILALNGIAEYPYFGGAVGFASTSSSLQPGSFNYAYVAGTSQVPRGPAVNAPNAFSAATGMAVAIESEIWQLDSQTNLLRASWVNTDGSTPAIDLVYVSSSDAFAFVGDVGAFTANFGPVAVVALHFVQS